MGLDIPGATGSRPDAAPSTRAGQRIYCAAYVSRRVLPERSGWNSNGSSTTGNIRTFRSARSASTAP